MGTRFYGIAAAQNQDNSGETILIEGMDTSKLRGICDEHGSDAWSIIGAIDYHEKIYSEKDCKDDHQRRCWNHAKVPFLFIRGEFADDQGHPNAVSAATLTKFTSSRSDLDLRPGFSIEGGIAERSGPDDKILSKTVATMAAWTIKPCNPRCGLFLENDLAKSDTPPPPEYYEALKKSQATSSFRQLPKEFFLLMHLDTLKKSAKAFVDGLTSMKCHRCGNGIRFFKSSSDCPNRCPHCNSAFSASQIWSAINKR